MTKVNACITKIRTMCLLGFLLMLMDCLIFPFHGNYFYCADLFCFDGNDDDKNDNGDNDE